MGHNTKEKTNRLATTSSTRLAHSTKLLRSLRQRRYCTSIGAPPLSLPFTSLNVHIILHADGICRIHSQRSGNHAREEISNRQTSCQDVCEPGQRSKKRRLSEEIAVDRGRNCAQAMTKLSENSSQRDEFWPTGFTRGIRVRIGCKRNKSKSLVKHEYGLRAFSIRVEHCPTLSAGDQRSLVHLGDPRDPSEPLRSFAWLVPRFLATGSSAVALSEICYFERGDQSLGLKTLKRESWGVG